MCTLHDNRRHGHTLGTREKLNSTRAAGEKKEEAADEKDRETRASNHRKIEKTKAIVLQRCVDSAKSQVQKKCGTTISGWQNRINLKKIINDVIGGIQHLIKVTPEKLLKDVTREVERLLPPPKK